MAFLLGLLDCLRPIRRTDSLFGELRFYREFGWWEGSMQFEPTSTDVGLQIHACVTGPSHSQYSFMRDLQSRYGELEGAVLHELHVAADELRSADICLPSELEFVLVHVEVLANHGDQEQWEMGYTTEPPSCHFTVAMRGWEPLGVLPECLPASPPN